MNIQLKPRRKTSHKGQNGTVLVIGGSEDYIGAPTFVGMASMAVLRSGADLVTVAAPEKVAWTINCIAPDLMTTKIKCRNFTQKNANTVVKLARDADVVEIGNGIAFTPGAKAFMKDVIKKLVKQEKKLVIDAAALRTIKLQDARNSILLPHGGELKELLKNSKLTEKNMQKHLGNNILVKKGHPETAVMSTTKTAHTSTGNAGMTHGGTGDVLAGIVSGLWAQGNTAFMSAYAGCSVNGKAADLLYKEKGFGYIASDLIEKIPHVLKKFQKQK